MKKLGLLFGFLLLAFSFPSQAAEFNVSTGTAFQTALTTAASNGEDDTITLAAGTYDANADNGAPYNYFSSEAHSLTIQGTGIGKTILTGADLVGVLTVFTALGLHDDLGATMTLKNLTVEHGNTINTGAGADFSLNDASAVVDTVSFQNNVYTNTTDAGGALSIRTKYASVVPGRVVVVQNSIFENNESGGRAGGFFLGYADSSATMTISNNIVSQNKAFDGGGASALLGQGNLTVQGNTFSNNEADETIGGFSIHMSHISTPSEINVSNNIFQNNLSGTDTGGGFAAEVEFASFTLSSNLFQSNTSGGGGAGMQLSAKGDAELTLVNNVVSQNSSTGSAGGSGVNGAGILFLLSEDNNTINLVNNTIIDNAAPDASGGGLAFIPFDAGKVAVSLSNNIIYGNTALVSGGDIYLAAAFSGLETGVAFNFVANDYATLKNACTGCSLTVGAGNINANPDFVDFSAGDYHLLEASPCIGTANASVAGYPSVDFDGVSRASSADMGAFEFVGGPLPPPSPDDILSGDCSLNQSSQVHASFSMGFCLIFYFLGMGFLVKRTKRLS